MADSKVAEAKEVLAKHVLATARLVGRCSDAKHARVAGKHLESLVKMQLRASQFEIVGEHTAEYDGKKWDEANRNLDFVARRKGKDFAIGAGAKNAPGCMRAEEIGIKIDMCKDLEIVPVFAVRRIRPYIGRMRKQGGFSWIFKAGVPSGLRRVCWQRSQEAIGRQEFRTACKCRRWNKEIARRASRDGRDRASGKVGCQV